MYKYKLKEIEVGDVGVRGGVKSTVTDIDPITGGITWSITDVAAFDTVYKTFNKLKKFLKKLETTGEAEKDPVLDEISDKVEDLFSDYWTHIRSTYPEAYDKIKLTKESVNEAKETFYFDDILDILNGSSFSQEIKPTDPKVKELLQKKYKNIVDFARTVASTYNIKPELTLNSPSNTPPKSFLVTRAFNFMSKEFGSDRFNQPNYKNITPGEYKLIKSRRGKHTYLNPNNVKITLSDSDMATLTRPENDLVTNIVKESVNEVATDRFLKSAARNLAGQMRGKSASRDTLMNRLNSMPLANRLKSDELDKIIDYTMQEMGLINEAKKMTFGDFLNDLDNRLLDILRAAKGLNSKDSNKIDMRASLNQNFTLFRNYISKLKKEYSNELGKELTFTIDEDLEEGTFHGPREIAIYDGPDGETYIEKRGLGYYGYNNSFDFEAEDKAELKHKLNSWGYRLVAGSIDEGEGEGYLTPKAFDKNKKSTGANDIYYYKLGYKPVPKKIKGSGLEVKQLFEKEELKEYSDFQQKRIQQFTDVEEKLNQISPLLSNAKNETAKFYNENPGSYEVVYSTDMVGSLIDDITELLKQEE